ncbi:MAG TPA: VWA domain-containing protein [Blastocatellia bacterium]|nr:VWA domain-containing protein [Blastocatellia bacterium]
MRVRLVIALLISAMLAASAPFAQEKKQKREKFGSSLKRLKWDDRKQAASESRKRKEKSNAAPADEDTIKLETLYVALDVTVTDRATSRFITGLTKDDFILSEDGRPQQIAACMPGDDATKPRSIVLILDYSGSQSAYLDASIDAATTLINQLAPADEMAIATDDVELLIDFTRDKARLAAALAAFRKQAHKKRNGLRQNSRSLQFTALFAALRELIQSEGAQPVIIFQTDGDEAATFRDQDSTGAWREAYDRQYGAVREYGLNDILLAARKSRAVIYSVIPGERLAGLPPEKLYERGRQLLEKMQRARYETEKIAQLYSDIPESQVRLFTDRFARGQAAAMQVAETTGGWTAYLERPEQAAEIYRQILADINHRYTIGYYPTNMVRDGRLRQIRIEVRGHPEYIVHGRASYYAPGR